LTRLAKPNGSAGRVSMGAPGIEPASPRLHAMPLWARIGLFAGASWRTAKGRFRSWTTLCGFSCGQ